MKTERIKEIFAGNSIFLDEKEIKQDLGNALYDLMTAIAEEIEIDEPYATNPIRALRDVRGTVQSYCDDSTD